MKERKAVRVYRTVNYIIDIELDSEIDSIEKAIAESERIMPNQDIVCFSQSTLDSENEPRIITIGYSKDSE